MFKIKIEVGVNNCFWNVGGICTSPKLNSDIPILSGFVRCFKTKKLCDKTILSAQNCKEFLAEGNDNNVYV